MQVKRCDLCPQVSELQNGVWIRYWKRGCLYTSEVTIPRWLCWLANILKTHHIPSSSGYDRLWTNWRLQCLRSSVSGWPCFTWSERRARKKACLQSLNWFSKPSPVSLQQQPLWDSSLFLLRLQGWPICKQKESLLGPNSTGESLLAAKCGKWMQSRCQDTHDTVGTRGWKGVGTK